MRGKTKGLRLFGALMLLLVGLVFEAPAKEWRGIVPLKSTKSDVETILGRPTQFGDYRIQNERASFLYSEGPCEDAYQFAARTNCECLVAKGIVLKITVRFDSAVTLSALGIDKAKFERTPFPADQPSATFSDFNEGVVYSVTESDDLVRHIDYLPSAQACQDVIKIQTLNTPPNTWRGIVPLRSKRSDVERMLGSPKTRLGGIYSYDLKDERADVVYSSDPCEYAKSPRREAPNDFVLRVTVSPYRTLLVNDLKLDKNKFKRIPNVHPENWVDYLDSAEGITIRATLDDGREQVMQIIYEYTAPDRALHCGPSNP